MDAFDQIKRELEEYDLESVAESAEIHPTTLYNWIQGYYKPRYSTLEAVANALGYRIIVKLEKK